MAGNRHAIIMGQGDPDPNAPEPLPTPLSRGIVKGIYIPFLGPRYPAWMYGGYYTMGGVAISNDGKKHWPKKLSPSQQVMVEEARRVIAYYDRKKP